MRNKLNAANRSEVSATASASATTEGSSPSQEQSVDAKGREVLVAANNGSSYQPSSQVPQTGIWTADEISYKFNHRLLNEDDNFIKLSQAISLKEMQKFNGSITTKEEALEFIEKQTKCKMCGKTYWDKWCPSCVEKQHAEKELLAENNRQLKKEYEENVAEIFKAIERKANKHSLKYALEISIDVDDFEKIKTRFEK